MRHKSKTLRMALHYVFEYVKNIRFEQKINIRTLINACLIFAVDALDEKK